MQSTLPVTRFRKAEGAVAVGEEDAAVSSSMGTRPPALPSPPLTSEEPELRPPPPTLPELSAAGTARLSSPANRKQAHLGDFQKKIQT